MEFKSGIGNYIKGKVTGINRIIMEFKYMVCQQMRSAEQN